MTTHSLLSTPFHPKFNTLACVGYQLELSLLNPFFPRFADRGAACAALMIISLMMLVSFFHSQRTCKSFSYAQHFLGYLFALFNIIAKQNEDFRIKIPCSGPGADDVVGIRRARIEQPPGPR